MNKLIGLTLFLPFTLIAQTNYLTTADSLFQLGKYSKAIELFEEYKQVDNVYEKLARSYQAIGNYAQSLSYYDLAIQSTPEDLVLKYDYAKLLMTLKKYNTSKRLFEQLVKSDSLNPNYYFEMGRLAEQTGDSLSINYYNTTYNLDQKHQKAIYKIARYKLVKRKHLESNEYVDKGLKLYAENLELISLKAQNFYWIQDYEKAIFWFEKLISLGENSELIYEKLSISHAENYNYEKAIEYRKKALAYNPENADALKALAVYNEYLQYFDKAEEYMQMCLSIKDQNLSDDYQKLGVLLNRQKKYAQAIEAFKKSLEEDPSNMSSDFFMALSKDQYYEDIDARIKVFKDLETKYKDSPFKDFASSRLKELQEEKFKTQN